LAIETRSGPQHTNITLKIISQRKGQSIKDEPKKFLLANYWRAKHESKWVNVLLKNTSISLKYKQGSNQGILKGKYHCTADLLFDWFGLVCFANKNKNCQLSYS
jgi:hypothetical protein